MLSKKTFRTMMLLFGVLDILNAFRGYKFPLNAFKGLYNIDPLTVVVLLFHLSLIVSGILLIRGEKTGYYVYYIQFIFKFLLFIFTFGFLFDLLAIHSTEATKVMTVICGGLEVVRLLLTLGAARKS